jgi:RNA polymerase sigma-70 factor (ECF subfamily)
MDASAPPEFERVLLPHLDAAYNLARWLLRHEQDAEDAVQDAYLRAYRSFTRFRGGDGRSWLLTIVRNVCYSRLRTTRAQPAVEPFDEELHPAGRNDSGNTWGQIKTELLPQALAQLEPEFREVIVLHHIEGLAYREIAEIVSVPIGTVMSRLSRARAKLERELSTLAPRHGL